jgi:hypothetical protein
MRRKQKQQQEATPTATEPAPKTGAFNYSAIPSSTKLWQVIEQMPPVPNSWRDMADYCAKLEQWREALRQAAYDVTAAANDATGLMCDIVDGRRKVEDDATRLIAMVTAVRA